jgi:hypothetical protein
MLKVAIFLFFYQRPYRACLLFNLGLKGFCESLGVSELKLLLNMMLRLHVPISGRTGHVDLSWKKSQRHWGASKHITKVSLQWEKKNIKNNVSLNPNGEHIAVYLIHYNKNITKWKSKRTKHSSKLNGVSTIYVLQCVKSFIIYYIKCVCPRVSVSKVYVEELRWELVETVSSKKT